MSSVRAKFWTVAAICCLGTVFQAGLPTSCIQFGAQAFAATFDTCAILNCEGGVFFNLCDPVVVLVDCPEFAVPDTP